MLPEMLEQRLALVSWMPQEELGIVSDAGELCDSRHLGGYRKGCLTHGSSIRYKTSREKKKFLILYMFRSLREAWKCLEKFDGIQSSLKDSIKGQASLENFERV